MTEGETSSFKLTAGFGVGIPVQERIVRDELQGMSNGPPDGPTCGVMPGRALRILEGAQPARGRLHYRVLRALANLFRHQPDSLRRRVVLVVSASPW